MKQSTAIKLLSSLSALALVLVFFMLLLNMNASNRFDDLAEKSGSTISYAEQFVDASAYLTQEVRSYVATADNIHYDNYWQEVSTDQNREKAVANLEEIGITPEEKDLIAKIQSLSNGLVPIEEEAMQLTRYGVNSNAISLVYSGQYEDTISQIHSLQEQLTQSIQERTTTDQDKLGFKIDLTLYFTFASLLVVVVIQMVVIAYVLRNILAPCCWCRRICIRWLRASWMPSWAWQRMTQNWVSWPRPSMIPSAKSQLSFKISTM